MRIEEFYAAGDLSDPLPETTDDLLGRLGNLLDDAEAHEILGEIVYRAEDGETYVATLEANIAPADPEYRQQVVEDYLDGDAGAGAYRKRLFYGKMWAWDPDGDMAKLVSDIPIRATNPRAARAVLQGHWHPQLDEANYTQATQVQPLGFGGTPDPDDLSEDEIVESTEEEERKASE